jgi:hypothetical protein
VHSQENRIVQNPKSDQSISLKNTEAPEQQCKQWVCKSESSAGVSGSGQDEEGPRGESSADDGVKQNVEVQRRSQRSKTMPKASRQRTELRQWPVPRCSETGQFGLANRSLWFLQGQFIREFEDYHAWDSTNTSLVSTRAHT